MNLDEEKDRDILKKLEDLGLTDKESRVYLALLPRQDTGTSKLIRATGLHGQFVYDALQRLEEIGLAKHAVQNGHKKFSATSPLLLVSLAEQKRLTAQTLARELKSRFNQAPQQDFSVFQGESAFLAHEFAQIEEALPESYIYVIGSKGDKFMDILGPEGNEWDRMRVEKRINVRYIGALEQRNYLQIMASHMSFFEVALFPGLSSGLVSTDIRPTSVTLNIFGNPVLSFTVKSQEVADGYMEFFESLWAISTK